MISKIKSLDEVCRIASIEKKNGKSIVLANGCFDLLHVGHIRYLQGAKAEGELLIVALNSDNSVRRLKGPNRPLMMELERAEIIAALSVVDYVTIFDDVTVNRILCTLRPDVHAKGTDYTEESVPERETVMNYGGRVAIVGDPKDHSSRDLVKEIIKGHG